MSKGMKLPFLLHSNSLDPNLSSSHPPWPWPSCVSLKTLSFRATDPKDNFRTFNSAFLDTEVTTPPDSSFTVSSSERFSTVAEDSGDALETVIRGLRSDRLFFEPEKSSSLVSMPSPLEDREHKSCSSAMEEQEPEQEQEEEEEEEEDDDEEEGAYKESEMLSMESENPYEDFRRSMEEMVEAHGLKDWEGLEELLRCYLKINGKANHGYVVGAFIDLLVNLCFVSFASSSSPTSTTTPTTITATISSSRSLSTTSNYSSPSSPLSLPSSSLTTPCLSSILDHVDDDDHNDVQHDGDDDDDGISHLDGYH